MGNLGFSIWAFWAFVTRLGEAQILLPAALAAVLWLLRRDGGRPLVAWWLALLTLATALTTASKVAFIGYGLGIAEINFTGISGHAMFSAAVYPMLFGTLGASLGPRGQRAAVAAGAAMALLIGVSRVMVGAHSVSEVIAGLALGAAASGLALTMARLPHAAIGWAIPAGMAAWLALTPVHAPSSHTHDWVTKLSLKVSGRAVPYTRHQMMREWRARQSRPLGTLACPEHAATPPCAPTTARPPAT